MKACSEGPSLLFAYEIVKGLHALLSPISETRLETEGRTPGEYRVSQT